MKYLIIVLLIFLVPIIFATCSENQIDINSASLEELDNLEGVGPTIAQYIIDARPFDSVDDLINVEKIAEGRLEKIKAQGLACVEKTDRKSEDKNNKEDEDEKEVENDEEKSDKEDKDSDEEEDADSGGDEEQENLISFKEEEKEVIKESPPETIKLNSKDIKTRGSEEDKETEKNYAGFGLLSFCVLLGLLFGIKKLKLKNYKNEFD